MTEKQKEETKAKANDTALRAQIEIEKQIIRLSNAGLLTVDMMDELHEYVTTLKDELYGLRVVVYLLIAAVFVSIMAVLGFANLG